ncbi:MAG: capsular biosynthesis protein [Beijerinckiaceae bacterium]|nr:capsular biosynthesis protein [Beijerinckiaceae bacterium]
MTSPPRVILMLHGPTAPFWRELGRGFEAAGHRVVKVHFALGEFLYWGRPGGIHYRGSLRNWPDFLRGLIRREGITDILYYADRFAYHVAARQVAEEAGLQAYALENGYLRPDWITLERGGMGAYSHMPVDPARYIALAAGCPPPDLAVRYPVGFWTEILHEVTYSWFNFFWRVLYPGWQSGKYYNSILEVLVGIPHLLRQKGLARAAEATIEARLASGRPYFVLPLQLQGDYQIRDNSPFTHIAEMIETVFASFARQAPAGADLVVKQHPHDNNAEDFATVVQQAARRHGLADRVFFIDGGDLGRLLASARGCVMINSTVGLFSLRKTCPTKILGAAIYDMPGLTHQGPLDGFWQNPEPVDAALVEAFVRVLAATIQVKGSFYHPEGRRQAVETVMRRILEGRVNEPGAFVDPPPRLEAARRIGVPVDRDPLA